MHRSKLPVHNCTLRLWRATSCVSPMHALEEAYLYYLYRRSVFKKYLINAL